MKEVFQGYASIATGQFFPSSWAFEPSVKPYAYDPTRAKAILAEAGWKPGPDGVLVKDGKRFSFSIRHDQASQSVKDAVVIIQEYLKRIGVEARLEPLDWPTFVKKLFASEFEGILVSWTNHHDPDPFAYTIWHSSQWKGRNFAHYKNPRVDEALEAARRTANQAERKKHYAEFSRLLMEDAPYVFLYFGQQVYVTRQGYEGFVPIPAFGGIYQSLKHVRWTGKLSAEGSAVTPDEFAWLGIADLGPLLAHRQLSRSRCAGRCSTAASGWSPSCTPSSPSRRTGSWPRPRRRGGSWRRDGSAGRSTACRSP